MRQLNLDQFPDISDCLAEGKPVALPLLHTHVQYCDRLGTLRFRKQQSGQLSFHHFAGRHCLVVTAVQWFPLWRPKQQLEPLIRHRLGVHQRSAMPMDRCHVPKRLSLQLLATLPSLPSLHRLREMLSIRRAAFLRGHHQTKFGICY